VALVMLNAEAILRATAADGRAALEESLALHVQRVNALLDPHEQLDCLVVVSEAWTVENDLVTPTLKVKRNRIETVYAQHYEHWVAERKAVVWQR
jgi:long-chain acyl-CoA synthetase